MVSAACCCGRLQQLYTKHLQDDGRRPTYHCSQPEHEAGEWTQGADAEHQCWQDDS